MPDRFKPSLDRISDAQEYQLKRWVNIAFKKNNRLPAIADLKQGLPPEVEGLGAVVAFAPGSSDYRFDHIGDVVIARSHADYSGRALRDIPGKGPDSLIWQFVADIARLRHPSISILPYVGPSADFSHVTVLGLPTADDGVNVNHVQLVADFVTWPFLTETSAVTDKTNSLRKYLFEIYDKVVGADESRDP